jgi:hypothetical protein
LSKISDFNHLKSILLPKTQKSQNKSGKISKCYFLGNMPKTCFNMLEVKLTPKGRVALKGQVDWLEDGVKWQPI